MLRVVGPSHLVTVVVALLPLYMVMQQLEGYLTPEGKKIARHPLSRFIVAYGTAMGAVGDATVTFQSVALIAIGGFYVFTLRPELGRRYIDFDTVQKKYDTYQE